MELGCQIIRLKREIETGHFVCVRSPEDEPEPFYIAQVLSSNDETEEFNIHWYEPTKASRARGGLFENMFFQEELDNMRIKGRFKGQPRDRKSTRLNSSHSSVSRMPSSA